MHDRSLFITHVQCSCSFATRRCQVIVVLGRGMVLDTFIVPSDISFLPSKQLQHQYNQQDLSVNLAIFSLDNPPYFLILSVKNLSH